MIFRSGRGPRLAGEETFGWKQLLGAPQCGPLRADLGALPSAVSGPELLVQCDLEIRPSPLEKAQELVLLHSGFCILFSFFMKWKND